MSNYREIEVKLYTPNLSFVAKQLEQAHAKLVKPRVYERNVRYENSEQTLTPSGIVVRLRQDETIKLTYKEPDMVQSGIVSRFEAEIEVSDFDAMQMILVKLGYHPYMVYEKYRTTYELDGAEIVLDEMPYGNFVEVEGDIATIERILNLLGLGDAERYAFSYARLFDFVKYHLNLNFKDLTFDNFAGITVPESAFEPPIA